MSLIAAASKAGMQIEINGKEVELSPLTIKDLGAMLQYCQYREYQALRGMEEVPNDLVRQTLLACAKKIVTLQSGEFLEALSTPNGIVEVLWLSARHAHPDIDREAFLSLPLPKLQELSDVVAAISGLVDMPTEDAGDTEKKV